MASLGMEFDTSYSSVARANPEPAAAIPVEKASQPGAGAVISQASGQSSSESAQAVNRGAGFCIRCGSALIDNADFCAHCGQPVGASPEFSANSGHSAAVRHKAGEVLHLSLPKGVGLDMVWCPPGTFVMGSPAGELGHHDNEVQHRVTLTKGFWMAKYALTQEQYEALMESNPSEFRGRLWPVECVSWDESVAYCEKLNSHCSSRLPSGYKITLPTEAQWEYACRAGTISALNSGQELTSALEFCDNVEQVAWYGAHTACETHKVGKKPANAWGLYDMHGNVWEWCSDWCGSYGGDATDPVGPSTGAERVVRGGSWGSSASGCRSAFRRRIVPAYRNSNLGFRPVCAPVQ